MLKERVLVVEVKKYITEKIIELVDNDVITHERASTLANYTSKTFTNNYTNENVRNFLNDLDNQSKIIPSEIFAILEVYRSSELYE